MKPTMMPRRSSASVVAVPAAARKLPLSRLPTTTKGETPIPKFAACYAAILQGSEKPAPYSPTDVERFYFDLFCLDVDRHLLTELCRAVQDSQLTESGVIRNNIRELFFYAVGCLKAPESEGDVRPSNVLETLSIVLGDFLSRPWPDRSVTAIHLLAGTLDQADAVFTVHNLWQGRWTSLMSLSQQDFVTAVDDLLQSSAHSTIVKGRAIFLALLFIAAINQGSVNAYFLRRDLFNTIIKLVSVPATAYLAGDGMLMLGILANYHKYEARNAILVRFEDLVDDGIMKRLRESASASLLLAREMFNEAAFEATPTLVESLTSLVSTFWSLGSPSRSPSKPDKTLVRSDGNEIRLTIPPEITALLLPLYDLVNSNKAFCAFLLNDRSDVDSAEPDFLGTLVSYSSYLASHASQSTRARLYCRLAFAVVAILVEEGPQVLLSTQYACDVRLCRQRQPLLSPSSDTKRPCVLGILDCITLFLRCNLARKQFDSESYLLVLQIVHKIMHQLKSTRVRLNYDWSHLLQALLALARFLQSRQAELCDLPSMEELINQLILTLDFGIVWADVLQPDADAIAQQLYEVLRADEYLTKLGKIANPAIPTTPRLPSPQFGTPRRISMSGSLTPKSPTLGSMPCPSPRLAPEMSGPSAQSVRNLAVIKSHFGTQLDNYQERHGITHLDEDQVMSIIKSSMDGLDLRESIALEDAGMRRYSESEHEGFFSELVETVARDVLMMTRPAI